MSEKQTNGLASSIAFTPMRSEIELINPDAIKKPARKEPEQYFSRDSGFRTVLEGKKSQYP